MMMTERSVFYVSQFQNQVSETASDEAVIRACFDAVRLNGGGRIIFEPVTYHLEDGMILLPSDTEIFADGTIFQLPDDLGDKKHRIFFYGKNTKHLSWHGGKFTGHVFRPDTDERPLWEPDAYTPCIFIESLDGDHAEDLFFEKIRGDRVAAAVINVHGRGDWDPAQLNRIPAKDIDVRDCDFHLCGKFMWDYGYLWERITFPERFTEKERELARRYVSPELMTPDLTFQNGSPWIESTGALPVFDAQKEAGAEDRITFFGNSLPPQIERGKSYPVLEQVENAFRIGDPRTGKEIRFDSIRELSADPVRAFRNLHTAFHWLYIPRGAGLGKGAIDICYCDNVNISGCRLNAAGDTMHIHSSRHVVFSGNQITGSRMGAFYIAAYCRDVTVAGNTVNGTNGSRVMSVERSTDGITITGNTFYGGGRGSWINQPYNMILSDNLLIENTHKCDPETGRFTPETGCVEEFPELYFTTWQENAEYGPVIVRGNIIRTLGHNRKAAIAFHDGGHDLVLEGNVFQGLQRRVFVGERCEMPLINGNSGMGDLIRKW